MKDLRSWFTGVKRAVIVGVGNPIRRDDNVGIEIVRRLRGKVPRFVLLIESETVPENFLQDIVEFKPTHTLVIDAAMMGLKAGEVRLLESEEIGGYSISTHSLPLRIFMEYIGKNTSSKVALLAIQPEDVRFGEGLTTRLARVSREIADTLQRILSNKK